MAEEVGGTVRMDYHPGGGSASLDLEIEYFIEDDAVFIDSVTVEGHPDGPDLVGLFGETVDVREAALARDFRRTARTILDEIEDYVRNHR